MRKRPTKKDLKAFENYKEREKDAIDFDLAMKIVESLDRMTNNLTKKFCKKIGGSSGYHNKWISQELKKFVIRVDKMERKHKKEWENRK